jgi:hypothetical protein
MKNLPNKNKMMHKGSTDEFTKQVCLQKDGSPCPHGLASQQN